MKILKPKLLKLITCPKWRAVVENFFNTENGKQFLDKFIGEMNKSTEIFPDFPNIFDALNLTPFDEVKVVIVGREPYKSGAANGLAFGVEEDFNFLQPLPASIKAIEYTFLHKGVKRDRFLFDDTLYSLAKEGVLLLNLSLTSSPNRSHEELWRWFTAELINVLDQNKKVVWVSFGKYPHAVVSHFAKKSEDSWKVFVEDPINVNFDCEFVNVVREKIGDDIIWY